MHLLKISMSSVTVETCSESIGYYTHIAIAIDDIYNRNLRLYYSSYAGHML